MVYKKYIKRNGKKYGPYYYKNVRTNDGKVKNIFLGKNYKVKKNLLGKASAKDKRRVTRRVTKQTFRKSLSKRKKLHKANYSLIIIWILIFLGLLIFFWYVSTSEKIIGGIETDPELRTLKGNINLKDEVYRDVGNVNVYRESTGEINLEVESGGSKAIIKDIKNINNTLNFYISKDDKERSDIVFIENDVEFSSATITLMKNNKDIEYIKKCENENFNTNDFSCDNWIITTIPFNDLGDRIEFSVNSFSAYVAGADNAELRIWDDTENYENCFGGECNYSKSEIYFYANYTGLGGGLPILGATCTIKIDHQGGDLNLIPVDPMNYNPISELYEYSTSILDYKGEWDWDVSCDDGGSFEDFSNLMDTYFITNSAPTIPNEVGGKLPPQNCFEDTNCVYDFGAESYDPDANDVLTYSYDSGGQFPCDSGGLNPNPVTGMINVLCTHSSDAGSDYEAAPIVTDNEGAREITSIRYTINAVNDDPIFTGIEESTNPTTINTHYNIETAHTLTIYSIATDEEDADNTLTYSTNDPRFVIRAPATSGIIDYTATDPDAALPQPISFTLTVKDNNAPTQGEDNIVIEVTVGTNDAPYFDPILEDKYVKIGGTFYYDIDAIDPEGDGFTFRDDSDDFDINPISGLIEWSNVPFDGGQTIIITVTDDYDASYSEEFDLIVGDNIIPTILYYQPLDYNVFMDENETISFNVTAYDPDDLVLSYLWKFNGETFNRSTNATYNALFNSSINMGNNISVKITDDSEASTIMEWNLTIFNVNRFPYLTNDVPNKTFGQSSINTEIDLDNYFSDPDNENQVTNDDNDLNYSWSFNDTDVEHFIDITINNETGVVRIDPNDDFIGNDSGYFIVDDGQFKNISNNITLEVIEQEAVVVNTPSDSQGPGSSALIMKGSSSTTKVASLSIIIQSIITADDNSLVIVPLTLKNTGQLTLNNINLYSYIDSDDAILSLQDNNIPNLGVNQEFNTNLIVKTLNLMEEKYEITIMGNVTSPKLFESNTIYLTSIPTNLTKLEVEIIFARDLFEENSECLELVELIDQAESARASGSSEEASRLIDTAVKSCSDILKDVRIARIQQPINYPPYFIPITAAILVLLLVTGASIYRVFRRSKKKD